MNANLLIVNHHPQRDDVLATNSAAETTRRSISILKPLMRLMLALTILIGLTASRTAYAQDLNLSAYTSFLTLTDGNTNKSMSAYLVVYQDNSGNLTGYMDMNNVAYQVTGTLAWYGPGYWSNFYWLDITATYTSPWWELYSSTTFHLSDWVYDGGAEDLVFYTGNYTWSADEGFRWFSGSGTFSGYGFVPPN